MHRSVKALELLVQHTVRKANTGDIGARQLANTAHGAARSGRHESLVVLFAVLMWVAERRVGEFNVQELANTAWAFAKVRQAD